MFISVEHFFLIIQFSVLLSAFLAFIRFSIQIVYIFFFSQPRNQNSNIESSQERIRRRDHSHKDTTRNSLEWCLLLIILCAVLREMCRWLSCLQLDALCTPATAVEINKQLNGHERLHESNRGNEEEQVFL